MLPCKQCPFLDGARKFYEAHSTYYLFLALRFQTETNTKPAFFFFFWELFPVSIEGYIICPRNSHSGKIAQNIVQDSWEIWHIIFCIDLRCNRKPEPKFHSTSVLLVIEKKYECEPKMNR